MKLPFSSALARWRGARLLRAVLTEQRRIAIALETLTDTVEAFGRLLAAVHRQPWIAPRARQIVAQDASSVGAPDDAFFADIEAIADDYRLRHGRELSPDELLAVYTDHQTAAQIAEDQEPRFV